MRGAKSKTVVFKEYHQNQTLLLPPTLTSLIEPKHPIFAINAVLDKIEIKPLASKMAGGVASSYHPRMMLKVLVYGYLSNIYSSRKLEAACKENIHFMWLTSMQTPDHHTLNRFRSKALNGCLKEIFKQVVLLLVDEGLLSLQEIYVDGTKIESAAGRYTFVWAKSIAKSKERISKQLEELWEYSHKVCKEEEQTKETPDFKQVTPENVEKAIDSINEALQDKEVEPKVRQKLNYAKKNWPTKVKEYEVKEKQLGERHSMSKTDPDATFMRMKEDHMLNGQLKPGYNCQISTSNQFVTNYSLHQTSTDTTTLETHLQSHKELYGRNPAVLTADAGYGSHENYAMLEREGIKAIVKYGSYEKERTGNQAKNPFNSANFYYNAQEDYYVCPMRQKMKRCGTASQTTPNGFKQELHCYKAIRCSGCPLRGQCFKGR